MVGSAFRVMPRVFIAGWVAFVVVHATPARGDTVAAISEVLTGTAALPSGTLPSYVEVTLPGSGVFDLAVLEANPSRNLWKVYTVVHLDAANGPVQVIADTTQYYDMSTWPSGVPKPTATATLGLTWARALVLFGGVTGLTAADSGSTVLSYASQVLDAVTLSIGGASAADFPVDNHTFDLAAGDGVWRPRQDGRFADDPSSGPLEPGTLTFASDGRAMNPGYLNAISTPTLSFAGDTGLLSAVPEPTTGLLLTVTLACTGRGRTRRG